MVATNQLIGDEPDADGRRLPPRLLLDVQANDVVVVGDARPRHRGQFAAVQLAQAQQMARVSVVAEEETAVCCLKAL